MNELLIHRDGKTFTYSEMLLIQDYMRAIVEDGRRSRTDEYANVEPNFDQDKNIVAHKAER